MKSHSTFSKVTMHLKHFSVLMLFSSSKSGTAQLISVNPKDSRGGYCFLPMLHPPWGTGELNALCNVAWRLGKTVNWGLSGRGSYLWVLTEMHHLAPKRAHQHPCAVTAIALERTMKMDANIKKEKRWRGIELKSAKGNAWKRKDSVSLHIPEDQLDPHITTWQFNTTQCFRFFSVILVNCQKRDSSCG